MRGNTHTRTRKPRATAAPPLQQADVDLALKTMRGLADVAAGRSHPVAEVRARVLSRYTPEMASV